MTHVYNPANNKDKDAKWQSTSGVPASQIQTLRKLLDMAHTFVLEADAR